MVAAAMASWILPSDRKRSKTTTTNPNLKHFSSKAFFSNLYNHHHHHHHHNDLDHNRDQNSKEAKPSTLGILAFDTAKTMTNLISLYRAFSDAEIAHLRHDVIASRGVTYLNSDDESFLLALACAERLEDLDRVATSVSWLSSRCAHDSLSNFDLVYRDLKLGYVDVERVHHSSGAKEIERFIEKMERLIAGTVSLHAELDALSVMEESERRLDEWRRNGDSMSAAGDDAEEAHAASIEAFEMKIAAQRKLVRHLKEGSLWARSFDKTVRFAARVICVAFAHMCLHFGPYVTVLPRVKSTSHARSSKNNNVERYGCNTTLQEQMHVLDKLFDDPELLRESHSGPITGCGGLGGFGFNHNNKANLVRFMSRDFVSEQTDGIDGARATGGFGGGRVLSSRPRNRVFQAAPPSTVGGSGLALRYANLITLAEKYIKSDAVIDEQDKNELYDMLPARLRAQVRSKLNKSWRHVEVEAKRSGSSEALAVGWREASEEILNWLGPVARDTLTWLDEQCHEARRFDPQPTVLLMQTLHFSDLEKTEAAVAQVLVGLSCIYRAVN